MSEWSRAQAAHDDPVTVRLSDDVESLGCSGSSLSSAGPDQPWFPDSCAHSWPGNQRGAGEPTQITARIPKTWQAEASQFSWRVIEDVSNYRQISPACMIRRTPTRAANGSSSEGATPWSFRMASATSARDPPNFGLRPCAVPSVGRPCWTRNEQQKQRWAAASVWVKVSCNSPGFCWNLWKFFLRASPQGQKPKDHCGSLIHGQRPEDYLGRNLMRLQNRSACLCMTRRTTLKWLIPLQQSNMACIIGVDVRRSWIIYIIVIIWYYMSLYCIYYSLYSLYIYHPPCRRISSAIVLSRSFQGPGKWHLYWRRSIGHQGIIWILSGHAAQLTKTKV